MKGNVNLEGLSELDKLIRGRVVPQIYAFSTGTIPNYLKVGETQRLLDIRLGEWKRVFNDLKEEYAEEAKVDAKLDIFFHDYAVHNYLIYEAQRERLTKDVYPNKPFSNEFFKNAVINDVKDAIEDIRRSYINRDKRYNFYSFFNTEASEAPKEPENYSPRPNQLEAIKKFKNAIDNGRTKLLMYAVMRFGKSFTSMCCAKEMGAKVIVIVSAKADVWVEWYKTITGHELFKSYLFINQLGENTISRERKRCHEKFVIFTTLQDLHSDNGEIKIKHNELFNEKIDLLIVDETHFAARAEKLGKPLKNMDYKVDEEDSFLGEDEIGQCYKENLEKSKVLNKVLNAKVCLHLSGTPYRILMRKEFKEDEIIAFCQYSDIVKDKEEWNKKNVAHFDIEKNEYVEEKPEWENPYFGFPQLLRFAFNPNVSTQKKLEELKNCGATYAFSAIFRPMSTKKDSSKHNLFIHKEEVLDLLEIIDGSKSEEGMLGFLDYDKIKEGKMCRHIVCVLPFRASCDALEKLITDNKDKFKNLNQYEIINIAGFNKEKYFKRPEIVTSKISHFESQDKKTLSLTVSRMLTGCTVKEWDTMLYFKDTHSPQEYDQAIFRLQSPYIKKADDGSESKSDMKPQTLLVDFDPNRMFEIQKEKAIVYNSFKNNNVEFQMEKHFREDLEVSPIVRINKNKIELVTPINIIKIISEYSKDRSIIDEATDIPVDLSLLSNQDILNEIKKMSAFGSRSGIKQKVNEGEGKDIDIPELNGGEVASSSKENKVVSNSKTISENEYKKKFETYYILLLYFAFLTKDRVKNLKELIEKIDVGKDNKRIASNLDIDPSILKIFSKLLNPEVRIRLSLKIDNINSLARDEELSPIDRARTAMKQLIRISSSEVVTPEKVANEMVMILPKDEIRDTTKILDIASKQGEFVYAVYKAYGKAVADNFYSIPTSKAAYEFTRKVYELLGLDIAHIESKYNSYDLIKENKPMIKNDKIMINNQEIKFDAIVGNPPYQKEGKSTHQPPIYHLFYNVAFCLSNKVSFITPGRFLFRAGDTPRPWMDKMLTDKHLKVVNYYKKVSDVFDNVDIKGGIVITLRDASQNFGGIGFFSEFEELTSIKNKVWTSDTVSLSNIVLNRGQYRFSDKAYAEQPDEMEKTPDRRISTSALNRMSKLFTEERPNDGHEYIQIYGNIHNTRVYRWFRKDYLAPVDNLYKYKVLVPKANGTGAIGEVLSTPLIGEPLIGEPLIGYTETYISIGNVDTMEEAEAIYKYVKTKFARCMLGILKVTQDNTKKTWKYVPLQDFTANSDIDWSKSVADIDKQLYKKYGLSEEEVQFIEQMIKPM